MALTQFEQWCRNQFGKRSMCFLNLTDKKLEDRRDKLAEEQRWAQDELDRRYQWDMKVQAASYAKDAGPDFKF